MIKYLTTFSTEADYNAFLASEDCPYVNVSHITGTNENKYYKNTSVLSQQPFTITVTAGANNNYYFAFVVHRATDNGNAIVYARKNNGDWQVVFNYPYDNWVYLDTLGTLSVNDYIQIKCDNVRNFTDFGIYGNENDDCRLKVSGNLNSLFASENFEYFIIPQSYIQEQLCHNLLNNSGARVTDAEDLWLPTNCLPQGVFQGLFKENTYLTKAPDLHAAYLPPSACREMFYSCTSLVNMPNIYATSIGQRKTFMSMFQNCTSLANVTPLHIDTVYTPTNDGGEGTFQNMFTGCTALTVAPSWNINWTWKVNKKTGDSNPYNWCKECFQGCTSLVSCDWNMRPAFDIDPNNIIPVNYESMFDQCSSLTTPCSLSIGETYGPNRDPINLNGFIGNTNVTELILSKVASPINYSEGLPLSGSGTIYVADNSVYLDPNSEYYGQSPISGWTVESINNYPHA